MTLRLYDENIGRMLIERSYPDTYYVNDGDITECITRLDPPYGNGFIMKSALKMFTSALEIFHYRISFSFMLKVILIQWKCILP